MAPSIIRFLVLDWSKMDQRLYWRLGLAMYALFPFPFKLFLFFLVKQQNNSKNFKKKGKKANSKNLQNGYTATAVANWMFITKNFLK